jgi:DNA transformation protein
MPERNSKVRRRIAAGKFRLRIRDLRNLGPRAERWLADAGIHSTEELRRRGALEAYLAVRRAGGTESLNMLWALAGALEPWPEGRDWREVAASEARLPLLLAVENRLAARKATLEAAGEGGRVPDRRLGRQPGPARRGPPKQDDPAPWVPGMPFETAGKSGRRSRRRIKPAS